MPTERSHDMSKPDSAKAPPSRKTPKPVSQEDSVEQELDEALRETFPASDPVAIGHDTTRPPATPGKPGSGKR